jgi:hypothetical protein
MMMTLLRRLHQDEVKIAQYGIKTPYRLNVTDEESGGYAVYGPELDIYTRRISLSL